MILPFSTHLNGKPTYFPEKIIAGLWQNGMLSDGQGVKLLNPEPFEKNGIKYAPKFDNTSYHEPKLHTIRADNNNRWRAGTQIHFYINNRRPDMFQFAPVALCVSVQRVFMSYFKELEISIDSRQLTHSEIDVLYKNDGFDNYDDFEAYFISQMNEDDEFSGKIFHWTDLKY